MSKWIPDSTLNLALDQAADVDGESVCSAQPLTYFEAVWAPMWVAGEAVIAGEVRRSPTDNNMCYECTVGGTTGATEPAWSEVADATFSDGTVTWKAHANYSLAACDLAAEDIAVQDKAGGGREVVYAEKSAIVSHRGGTVTHTAFFSKANNSLEAVTTASTTAPGDNDIISGRTTIFHSVKIGLSIT